MFPNASLSPFVRCHTIFCLVYENHVHAASYTRRLRLSGLNAGGISGEAAELNGDGLLDLVVAADPDNTGGATEISRYESKVYWNTGEHGAKANH
jgi:hypothetical protein